MMYRKYVPFFNRKTLANVEVGYKSMLYQEVEFIPC